ESRPAPDLGVEAYVAAEGVRQLARDRETEAGAAAVRHERPEEALAILRRNAGSRVLDRDEHGPVRLPELERDPAAVGRGPEGVREQVVDDLEDAVPVRDDDRPLSHAHREVDRARPRLLGERLIGALDEVLHPYLLPQEREPVGVEARQVEDVA